MTIQFLDDVAVLKSALQGLPVKWDGKESILTMQKAGGRHWRQMEWFGFYFEWLCEDALVKQFSIPGDKIGTTTFDLKRSVNWDMKSKAIKSDSHSAILNDVSAMDQSIEEYREHGLIIALCDVDYNDTNRTFQQWHSELKGGKSKYEQEREKRTSVSRYRKTRAELLEILFLHFTAENVSELGVMRQGRNSNGKSRPPKYLLNLEDIEPFFSDRLLFTSVDMESNT